MKWFKNSCNCQEELNKQIKELSKQSHVIDTLHSLVVKQGQSILDMEKKIVVNDKSIREENAQAISLLTKYLDMKFEKVGERKGSIVELLKRIAVLEGQLEDKNNVSS